MIKEFELIYTNYAPKLIGLAYKKLANKSLCFDMVQNAFVKCLEYLRLHPAARISKFILRKNVLINCAKENKETK